MPYDSLNTNRRYNLSGIYYDSDGNKQFYDNETDNYTQTHVHLHYTLHDIGHSWQLNTALFYTKGLGYYEQYKDDTGLAKYGIPDQIINGATYTKSDLIRQKGLDNDFYGLDVSANYARNRWQVNLSAGGNRYEGDHYGKVLWTQRNAGDLDYNRHWYDNTGTKSEFNTFAKAAYRFNDNLSAYANLQYRYVYFKMYGEDDDFYERGQLFLDTTYTWNFLNPQAGLQFMAGNHRAYASFAMVSREPNRSDLKDAEKNGIHTPPAAETLYDYEAGYGYYGEYASIGANLYYMLYDNQIVATGRVNDAYRFIMENAEKSYRMGLELSASLRLSPVFHIEGNLTVSRNKLQDYTNDSWSTWSGQRAEYFSEVDIAYSPNLVGAVTMRLMPKNLTLALTGKYVGEQYYDNTASADRRLDAYFPINFNADYNFKLNNVQCFAQLIVNNFFNIKYSSSAFVNYRVVFADQSPDYQERHFFPQAPINFAIKFGFKL